MSRRTATRPTIRIGDDWLTSILPATGHWGELTHSTRAHGAWECSWQLIVPAGWRHSALRYGAPVDINYGGTSVWAGTLDEPDWDSGQMVALGAGRDGDDAIALDGSGKATTVPNMAIDEAIARGVLPWTRVDDFGDTPVGQSDGGGLVTVTSVLDAWADENGSEWRVDNRRRLIIDPPDPTTPTWHVMPGSGDLGQAADSRADRVFVRYVSTATGRLATASYPATTPAGGIEAAVDVTDRGQMTATKAGNIAEARWNKLQGESGWTNGLTLTHSMATTPGGIVADLAQIAAGQTIRLLGVRDPRTGALHTDVVIGDTDYDWTEDSIQANPVGTAARTEDAVLESVTELASDALAATGGRALLDPDDWHAITPENGWTAGVVIPEYRIDPTGHVELRGRIETGTATNGATLFTLPVGYRPTNGPLRFVVVQYTAAGDPDVGRCDVDPSGAVSLYQGGLTLGSGFELAGVTFSTY